MKSLLVIIVMLCATTILYAQSISPSTEVFPDYLYDLSEGKKDFNSFSVRRAYLGVKGSFMKPEEEGLKINYRVTIDVKDFSDISSVSVDKETNAVTVKNSSINGFYVGFLKYAYLEMQDLIVKGLKLQLGQHGIPWVRMDEHLSGMRWWGPSFTDRIKKISSTDRGISILYDLPAQYGDIHFSIVNGEGYNSPELSKDKDFMGRISVRPSPDMDYLRGLMLHIYYGYGRTNEDKRNLDSEGIRERLVLALSYDSPYITTMGQYLAAKDGLDTKDTEPFESSGYAVWAKLKFERLLNIENETGIFVRFDSFDDKKKEKSDSHTYYIGGPYYYFVKNKVALGLDYSVKSYKEGSKTDEKFLILHGLIKY